MPDTWWLFAEQTNKINSAASEGLGDPLESVSPVWELI